MSKRSSKTLLPSSKANRASQVMQLLKNLPASAGDARDVGSIPGSGRFPRGGNGNPLEYSCLENPMDRGARQATVHRVANSTQAVTRRLAEPPKTGNERGTQSFLEAILVFLSKSMITPTHGRKTSPYSEKEPSGIHDQKQGSVCRRDASQATGTSMCGCWGGRQDAASLKGHLGRELGR